MKSIIILSVVLALLVAPLTALAQEPGSGGPIVEGNFSGSINFGALNPLRNNDSAAGRITALMFPTVVGASPFTQDYATALDEGVTNALTTGWSVSEDGLVYTFTLREDAIWSDGTSITATDVKFSFDAIASGVTDSPLNGYYNYVEEGNPVGVKEIIIVDDYTYQAIFEEASCTSLGLASGFSIVPAHVFGYDGSPDFDFATMVDHEFDTNPAAVYGPFEVANFSEGEAIGMTPIVTYPDGVVVPSGFVYRDVPDQTVEIEQFLAGELNFLDGPSAARRDDLRADANVNAVDFPGNSWDYVGLNLADPANPQPGMDADGNLIDQGHHPIFGDVRVRRALQHAIDVSGIIEGAVFGEGTQMASNVIPTSWAADPDLAPIAYDPDLAAEMLDDAGWPVGPDGVRICQGCMYAEEGSEFEFELITNEGNVRREAIGVVVQDQLYDLGITVDFQAIDWQTLLERTFGGQEFDAYIIGWREGFPSDPDQLQLFGPSNDDPSSMGSNSVSFYNEDFINLSIEANSIAGCDPVARAEVYHQIQKIMQDEQPYLWLYAQNLMYAARTDVEGFAPEPNVPLWNIHTWQVAQ